MVIFTRSFSAVTKNGSATGGFFKIELEIWINFMNSWGIYRKWKGLKLLNIYTNLNENYVTPTLYSLTLTNTHNRKEKKLAFFTSGYLDNAVTSLQSLSKRWVAESCRYLSWNTQNKVKHTQIPGNKKKKKKKTHSYFF